MEKHASKCKTHDKVLAAGHFIPRKCDCDGYHTFDELYDHRIILWIALCKMYKNFKQGNRLNDIVWRSKKHSDGSEWGGWFILGISKEPGEQLTYHLPRDCWGETDFAETLEKAPKFDGHTSDDVLDRIKRL